MRATCRSSLTKALKEWRRQQLEERMEWGEAWIDGDYVFTEPDGSPPHPDRISDRFRRLGSQLGLPSMPLHGARHSFATIALQSGVPMKIVSEMLGHSSIRVTADVYSHVSPGMSAEAAEVIADQMFNA